MTLALEIATNLITGSGIVCTAYIVFDESRHYAEKYFRTG